VTVRTRAARNTRRAATIQQRCSTFYLAQPSEISATAVPQLATPLTRHMKQPVSFATLGPFVRM